jgi:hypothetical protein
MQVRKLCAGGACFSAYCFGDGSGTACPCGNAGAADAGCANAAQALGAKLVGSGNASIAADSVRLDATRLPNGSVVLFFQANQRVAGGAGAHFGDGLR